MNTLPRYIVKRAKAELVSILSQLSVLINFDPIHKQKKKREKENEFAGKRLERNKVANWFCATLSGSGVTIEIF
jgi:hypothetical protein